MLQPGDVVERYTVEDRLGEGGMADVWRVRHTRLGTVHALKVLKLPTEPIRQRLLVEGRVQAGLQHPNIVPVTDIIDIGASPGLVMEYVRGPSLDALVKQRRLTIEQADHLADGILAGVAHAHKKGLIHRDLKPANILLALGDTVVPKVTDFGLAKLLESAGGQSQTRSGLTMGTPSFMAPEQIKDSKAVDHRADVFSLGAILYEMVTGHRAFTGEDVLAIFNKVNNGDYVPVRERVPDLPERMAHAIEGALQNRLEARIQTVRGLRRIWSGRSAGSSPFDRSDVEQLNALGSGSFDLSMSEMVNAGDSFPSQPSDDDIAPRASGEHVLRKMRSTFSLDDETDDQPAPRQRKTFSLDGDSVSGDSVSASPRRTFDLDDDEEDDGWGRFAPPPGASGQGGAGVTVSLGDGDLPPAFQPPPPEPSSASLSESVPAPPVANTVTPSLAPERAPVVVPPTPPPAVAPRNGPPWIAIGAVVVVLLVVAVGFSIAGSVGVMFGLGAFSGAPQQGAPVPVAVPVPTPVPAAVPAPIPVKGPKPVPSPQPLPSNTPPKKKAKAKKKVPAPAAAAGKVVVAGDAAEVRLVRGGQRFAPSSSLAAGSYTVEARFEGGTFRSFGSFELGAGETWAVTCNAMFSSCQTSKR